MNFRERYGYASTQLQRETISNELRVAIYNEVMTYCITIYDPHIKGSATIINNLSRDIYDALRDLWKYMSQPLDEFPLRFEQYQIFIKQRILNIFTWDYVYDFLDYLMSNPIIYYYNDRFPQVIEKCLEENGSFYRLVNNILTPIINDTEIESLDNAIKITSNDIYAPVNTHLKQAIDFLSDKLKPNYRNSIRESICSIESICKIITNKENATLGEAFKELEKT